MSLRISSLSVVFSIVIVGAAAVACGSSSEGSGFPNGSPDDPNGTSSGEFGTSSSSGDDSDGTPITVEPPTATLTITSRTPPLTQPFVAKANDVVVNAGWVL